MTLTAPVVNQDLPSSWTDGVTSKLNDMNDTYTRYTGTSTALSAGVWVDLTWPTLAEGTALGLSLASTTFTLTKAGLWTVIFSGITGTAASTTGAIFGLFKDTGHTGGTCYSEAMASLLANQCSATCTAEIKSDGTATVIASVFAIGGSPSMQLLAGTPRITFSCKDA